MKQYEAKIERKDGTKIMSWDVYLCEEYTGKVRGSMETKARWVGMHEISQVGELLPNVENAIQAAAEMV